MEAIAIIAQTATPTAKAIVESVPSMFDWIKEIVPWLIAIASLACSLLLNVKNQKKINEHEIKLRILHEKRTETIFGLISHLIEFHSTVTNYVNWDGFYNREPISKEDSAVLVADTLQSFDDYFRPRRIYLPKTTANEVWAVLKELGDIFINHAASKQNETNARSRYTETNRIIVKNRIRKLEDHFRDLLEDRTDA